MRLLSPRARRQRKQRGAKWASLWQLRHLVVLGPRRGRIILGRRDRIRDRLLGRLYLAVEQCHSVLAFGPPGSFKTHGLVIPAILEWQGNLVTTSIKPDVLRATCAHRANLGAVWVYGHRAVSPGGRSDTPVSGPARPGPAGVSRLDRVTLQLGVAVAVVIALCSYAVSATSLYALGVQAGYSWWQAAAVPVVADGPAIYGMFRIISRSRRNAKGAGYGWLLVGCGTLASIAGNVAHARPNLVAQAIAAAIPLAVLAMLEGLKGDASEVTRLAAQAAGLDRASALTQPGQLPEATTVRRPDPTVNLDTATAAAVGSGRPALPARPGPANSATVGARLQAAYGEPRPDGQPWTAPPWPRPPAVAAAAPPPFCNASAYRSRSAPGEPAHRAPARCCPWLCLPRHPGPAPALPPPPPRPPPAGTRRPSASGGDRLLVSGSRLQPGWQAPPGQPRPARGQGRHL